MYYWQIDVAQVDHLAIIDLFPTHPRYHGGVIRAKMWWIECKRKLVYVSYSGDGFLENLVAGDTSTKIYRRNFDMLTGPPPAIVDMLNCTMNTCLDVAY